ncbi:hypothetical protein D3Z53_17495 [Lachnospiraceae bacterium]|nr:hypothetical protein [Lachnospiraceae bacterium]
MKRFFAYRSFHTTTFIFFIKDSMQYPAVNPELHTVFFCRLFYSRKATTTSHACMDIWGLPQCLFGYLVKCPDSSRNCKIDLYDKYRFFQKM